MNRRSLLLAAVAVPLVPAPPAVVIPPDFVRGMQAYLAESDAVWAKYGQEVWFINTTVGVDRSEP